MALAAGPPILSTDPLSSIDLQVQGSGPIMWPVAEPVVDEEASTSNPPILDLNGKANSYRLKAKVISAT